MAPRFWTVTIDGRDFTVAAGTREAAQKIAARRAQQQHKRQHHRRRTGRAGPVLDM